MSRKPSPAAEPPAHPLPISGGCYTVEDGVLTPTAADEAPAPVAEELANTPANTPVNAALKEA